MLESVPNTPLGFQIQAHENKPFRKHNDQQADNAQADLNRQSYILLASTQELKNKWTYNIKHIIIETLKKAVPSDARDRLLRPVRGKCLKFCLSEHVFIVLKCEVHLPLTGSNGLSQYINGLLSGLSMILMAEN